MTVSDPRPVRSVADVTCDLCGHKVEIEVDMEEVARSEPFRPFGFRLGVENPLGGSIHAHHDLCHICYAAFEPVLDRWKVLIEQQQQQKIQDAKAAYVDMQRYRRLNGRA